MKIIASSIIALASVALMSCSSKDTVTTDTTVLPEAAQTVLTENFKDVKVSQIKVDKEAVGGDEYEVTLENGTYIDFNADGTVESVKAGANEAVPTALVPEAVATYVAANYPEQKIVKYEVDKNDIEVKLSSGLELKFDPQGNFLNLDH